jgi:hypothetical protein
MTSEKKPIKTPGEIGDKINDLTHELIFMDQKHQQKRAITREKIKILYWALGELEDEDLV